MGLRRVLSLGAATALIATSAVVVAVSPAGALSTFTVDKAGDTAAPNSANCPVVPAETCTLRDAFAAANAAVGDVQINIPASLNPITLTTGNVLSYTGTGALTLASTGGNAVVSQKAGAAQGVITDSSSGLLTVQGLTLQGGSTNTDGGGINDTGATGAVVVNDSTISGNHATGFGGGISTDPGSGGTPVTLNRSAVLGNTAAGGGGGISDNGTVVVRQSLVANNVSVAFGGGIETSSAQIINSTISNNSGGQGGGVDATLPIALAYSTVVDNTAATGANLDQFGNGSSAFGSVVALPHGSANCALGGAFVTFGYNLSDDASCGFTGPTDRPAGNPGLGALANNGGPTLTRLPATGSPLIDAIPSSACQASPLPAGTVDQRGFARPSPPGGACDIGAVEVQQSAPAVLVITPRFTG